MSDGTNFIRGSGSIPISTPLQEGPGEKKVEKKTDFREVLNERVEGESNVSFNLEKVLQSKELSFNQSYSVFRQVVEKIIENPSHPYSKIEQGVRMCMIDSAARSIAATPDLSKRWLEAASRLIGRG
jgi:hypothetical protein